MSAKTVYIYGTIDKMTTTNEEEEKKARTPISLNEQYATNLCKL